MPRGKRIKAEEIITKLRQAEIELAKGLSVEGGHANLFEGKDTSPGLNFEQNAWGYFKFDLDIYETYFEVIIPALNNEYELLLKTPGVAPVLKNKIYIGDTVEVRGMGDNQLRILSEFDSLEHLLKVTQYIHKNYKKIKK